MNEHQLHRNRWRRKFLQNKLKLEGDDVEVGPTIVHVKDEHHRHLGCVLEHQDGCRVVYDDNLLHGQEKKTT